jgi:hypothetical protein
MIPPLSSPRVALGIVFAVALASACRSGRITSDSDRYQVKLTAEKREYALPAFPRPGSYTISLDTANAPPKCRLRFDGPIPAGRYRITVSAPATQDTHTFTLLVPLMGGDYSFSVTATGNARYDFAFPAATSEAEHRFTLTAPIENRALDVKF